MNLSEKEIQKVHRYWLTCFVEIANKLNVSIPNFSNDPFVLARKFLSGEISMEELEGLGEEAICFLESEPRFWDTSIVRLWPARLHGTICGLEKYIRGCETDNIVVSFEVLLSGLEKGLEALGYDRKNVSAIVDSYWNEWPLRTADS